MRARWWMFVLLLVLCGCQEYETKEREIGYKGKARVNPYLAMERFIDSYRGQEMVVREGWKTPTYDDAMLILSVESLTSKELLANVQDWVSEGGHVVFLMENAEMRRNDWSEMVSSVEVPEVIEEMFDEVGITVANDSTPQKYQTVTVGDQEYKVELESYHGLSSDGSPNQALVTVEWGDGLITVLSDARLLRNRTIDHAEHAVVLANLLDYTRDGEIAFQRDVGVSFFGMLWQRAWMVLLALSVLLVIWLVRHMPRFGPVDADVADAELRAYDHHLEMIGDYHWRLDRGMSLLQPLRQEVQELCYHWQVKTGKLDEGLFELMASQAAIPFDRVQRAMTEWKPSDSLVFSRAVADLQQIRKAFL